MCHDYREMGCGSARETPAWVIAPLEDGKEFLAGIEMKVWPLPQPQFQLTKADSDFGWRRIDAFGVIACAGKR